MSDFLTKAEWKQLSDKDRKKIRNDFFKGSLLAFTQFMAFIFIATMLVAILNTQVESKMFILVSNFVSGFLGARLFMLKIEELRKKMILEVRSSIIK